MTVPPEELSDFERDVRRGLLEVRNQLAVLEEDLGNVVETCDGGMFTLAMNDTRKYMQFSIDALDLMLDSFPYYGVCQRKSDDGAEDFRALTEEESEFCKDFLSIMEVCNGKEA